MTALAADIGMVPLPAAAESHAGRIRKLNEDSFLSRPDLGLWAVADGMGGHDAGDWASRAVIAALAAIDAGGAAPAVLAQIRAALARVNQELRREARKRGADAIGSTVAVVVVRRGHYVCLWAGDSRVYLRRGGELSQLTRDHSAPAQPGRRKGLLTRAVGGADKLELEEARGKLEPGDRLLLCSDGLTDTVSDAVLRGALGQPDPEAAARELVELSLDAGAPDNVTAVVVGPAAAIRPLRAAAAAAAAPPTGPGWVMVGLVCLVVLLLGGLAVAGLNWQGLAGEEPPPVVAAAPPPPPPPALEGASTLRITREGLDRANAALGDLVRLQAAMLTIEDGLKSLDVGVDVEALIERRGELGGGAGAVAGPVKLELFQPGGLAARAAELIRLVAELPVAPPLRTTYRLSSPFGQRVHPVTGQLQALHAGLDFAAPTGTPVYATAPGVVEFAANAGNAGNMIRIDHGLGLMTRYLHLSEFDVAVGDQVDYGTLIGKVGATGRVTGPHLHYETRYENTPHDPMGFLRAGRRTLGVLRLLGESR